MELDKKYKYGFMIFFLIMTGVGFFRMGLMREMVSESGLFIILLGLIFTSIPVLISLYYRKEFFMTVSAGIGCIYAAAINWFFISVFKPIEGVSGAGVNNQNISMSEMIMLGNLFSGILIALAIVFFSFSIYYKNIEKVSKPENPPT